MTTIAPSTVDSFEPQVAAAREWFAQPRFDGIVRLHTAREVAAQQGTIQPDYTVARLAAEGFFSHVTKPIDIEVLMETLRQLPMNNSSQGTHPGS